MFRIFGLSMAMARGGCSGWRDVVQSVSAACGRGIDLKKSHSAN